MKFNIYNHFAIILLLFNMDDLNFNLEQFDVDSLTKTRQLWIESAGSFGIPELEYDRVIQWATQRIDYTQAKGDSFAYGIFSKKTQESVAIVDLVYTTRGNGDIGWLKMLEVSLAPTYSPAQISCNPALYADLLEIYASAILGTIRLTNDHRAKVVKLYGRDDDLLKLFVALNEILKTTMKQASSRMEGRWLVIYVN